MTFKEMIAAYVDFFGGAEDAMGATFALICVLFVVTVGFLLVWKFTLAVLLILGFFAGLFTLFLWANDEL